MQGAVYQLRKLPAFLIGSRFLQVFRGVPSRAQAFIGPLGHLLLLLFPRSYSCPHVVHGMVVIK